jgi:hypothetical protein
MATHRGRRTGETRLQICPRVTGGSETTPTSPPEISDAEYLQALVQSLGTTGVASASDDHDGRCYRLTVALQSVERGGFADKACRVSTCWTLVDPGSGNRWETAINAVGKATTADAPIGIVTVHGIDSDRVM